MTNNYNYTGILKSLGKNNEMDGMNVTSNNTTIMTIIHGTIALINSSNFVLLICEAINKLAPKGGVMKPIAKFKIMIKPK